METKINILGKKEIYFRVLKGRTKVVGKVYDLWSGDIKPRLFTSAENKELYTISSMQIEIKQDYEKYKTIKKNGEEKTGKRLILNFYPDGTISKTVWKA